MYSLSRSLYTQRSSGISSGAAAAFATSAQRAMIQQMKGEVVAQSGSSSSSSSSTSSTTSKSQARPAAPSKSVAAPAAPSTSTSSSSSSTQLQKPAAAVAAPPAHSQQTIARAIKRLMADLEEIMKSPLPSVVALPLDDDIFEWHCNVRGPAGSPYAGIVFHLILQFPENYPFKPPTLFFCSFIEHAHVFGSYVCLDMLQEAQFGSQAEMNVPYTGWSSAYSVQSILLQLQAFLFDEAGRDKSSVQKAALSAQRFKCTTCGHSHGNIWPAMQKAKPEARLVAAGPGVAKSNSMVPDKRLARPATLATKPKPRPVAAHTVAKISNEIKSVASKVLPTTSASATKSVSSAAPRPAVAPVDEPWMTVISKKTRQLQKRVEELGYDPRIRKQLAADKAKAAEQARKTKSSRKSSPLVVEAVAPEATPSVPRAVVGGERLVRKADVPSAPAPVVAPSPISSMSKEEKQKKRNQAKAKARLEKRKASRQQAPGPNAPSTTLVASVPTPVQSSTAVVPSKVATEEKLAAEDDVDFTLISRRGHASPTAPASSTSSTSAAVVTKKFVDLSRFLLPSLVETSLEKAFSAVMKDPKATGIDSSLFGFLSDELIYNIFSFLMPVELNETGVVCRDFLRLSGDRRLWRGLFLQRYRPVLRLDSEYTKYSVQDWKLLFTQENVLGRAGLQCYHSKTGFRETTLGVPVVVERRARFDELTSPFEYLSVESFKSAQVRKSVWGVPFTHWLPLWIDSAHGEAAWPEIEQAIASLSFRTGGLRFEPEMALSILPRLMNSLVVAVMSGNLHASIKSLEGYCAFHRLLLAFVQRYPRLLKEINKKARNFVKFESCRNKEAIPNLGEFLPLLTVATSVSWRDIALPYLQENFDRNVLWAIKKYPALSALSQTEKSGGVDEGRLKKTFDATIVSMRLLTFHVYFFQLARPDGVSNDQLAANYDAFFGVPSTQMKEALQSKIFEVLHGMRDWAGFFSAIGMKQTGNANIHSWLVQAVQNSSRKGYHSNLNRK
jgi:ubiquitin-protein ligase